MESSERTRKASTFKGWDGARRQIFPRTELNARASSPHADVRRERENRPSKAVSNPRNKSETHRLIGSEEIRRKDQEKVPTATFARKGGKV